MKRLFVGAALLVAISGVKAQTVDEISEKHLAAIGGKDNLAKVKNVVMEGTMDAMGNKVDVKVVKVPGKLYRQDISIMGMTGYNVITDTSGWIFMPFAGQSDPMQLSGNDLKNAQAELTVADVLVDYRTRGSKIQLKGTEDVSGSDCYKLEVVSPAGDTSNLFVDTKTYLISRSSTVKKVKFMDEEKEMAINIEYGDYKEIDGIKFPFSMGMQQGAITFTSVKTNQTIDPKVFSH